MTAAAWMVFATVLAGFGSVGTLAWTIFRDRGKQGVDKAQVEDIVKKTSRWRDARLAQYDRFWDEQDLPWHRAITKLLEQAKDAGFLPRDAVIPPPPVMPDPPGYD
jgi:hypothetical protein